MVSALIGSMLLAAVCSVMVLQSRLSSGIGNYADMNAGSRRALTLFEREMRAAQTLTVMEPDRVAGIFVTNVTKANLSAATPVYETHTIAYAYDKETRTLTRTLDGKTTSLVLADIEAFSLLYFDKNDAVLTNTSYTAAKKILISATLRRGVLSRTNSDYLVSAMVTMRNRIVTS